MISVISGSIGGPVVLSTRPSKLARARLDFRPRARHWRAGATAASRAFVTHTHPLIEAEHVEELRQVVYQVRLAGPRMNGGCRRSLLAIAQNSTAQICEP